MNLKLPLKQQNNHQIPKEVPLLLQVYMWRECRVWSGKLQRLYETDQSELKDLSKTKKNHSQNEEVQQLCAKIENID